MPYYVYILRCSDNTLYTGSTNDLERRLRAHNELKTGARYTKSRRPVSLVYSKKCKTKSQALKKECAFKKLPKKDKENIVSSYSK